MAILFTNPLVVFTVALKVIVTEAQAARVHRLPDKVFVLSVYKIFERDTLFGT